MSASEHTRPGPLGALFGVLDRILASKSSTNILIIALIVLFALALLEVGIFSTTLIAPAHAAQVDTSGSAQ
jgi:hypothetical protein